MKKIVVLLISLLMANGAALKAQGDTVKINLGKSKLQIIENQEATKITITDGENETTLFETEDGGKKNQSIASDNGEELAVNNGVENEVEEKPKKKKKKKKFKGHWSGFEFGFIGFLDQNNELINGDEAYANRPFRSWSYGLNLFQTSIPLIQENFGIVSGLGFNWRYYHFANPYLLSETSDGADFHALLPTEYDKIERNRLSAFYLHAPLAFEMQLPIRNNKSTLFIMAGAYGNLRLSSKYSTSIINDKVKSKEEIKSDFYLSDFEYGLTFRVGIDKINLYANYSLNPLFRKTSAPEFTPITVGIMIIPFS